MNEEELKEAGYQPVEEEYPEEKMHMDIDMLFLFANNSDTMRLAIIKVAASTAAGDDPELEKIRQRWLDA